MTHTAAAYHAWERISESCGDFQREFRLSVFLDGFQTEFRFVSVFLDCVQTWSRPAQQHEVVPADLVAKVAAGAKEILKEYERSAFLLRYPISYWGVLFCLWVTDLRVLAPREAKFWMVRRSLKRLTKKAEALIPVIGNFYRCTGLFNHVFTTDHHLPASTLSFESDAGWRFCQEVDDCLVILDEKSRFNDSLKKQMNDLQVNLRSMIDFLRWHFSSTSSSPIQENAIALVGAVATQAAHLYCMCWAADAAGMDQNMFGTIDVSVLVSDLNQRIDIAASDPEIVEMLLECILLHGDHRDTAGHNKAFLEEALHLQDGTPVLFQELLLLLNCLAFVSGRFRDRKDDAYQEMHNREDCYRFMLDIKAVIMEAALLKNREYKTGKLFDPTVLFAKIWFLKVEVFRDRPVSNIINLFPGLSMDNQIQALHMGSKFLTEDLRLAEEMTQNKILTLIEELPGQVESVYRSSDIEELKENKMRDILYKFLVKVSLLQAKKQLSECLDNNIVAYFTASVKCQLGTLHEGLIFLIAFASQRKEITEDDKKQLLTRIEALAAEVLFLSSSHEADKATEEALDKVSLKLCDLLEMLLTLKAKLKEIYLQLPRLNFSGNIHRLHLFKSLMLRLRELITSKPDSIACVALQIEAIYGDLESLVSSIEDTKVPGVSYQEQRDLYTRLINAANLAEHAIDFIAVGSSPEWHHLLWLYHASEEIKCIKMEIENATDQHQTCDVKVHDVVWTSSPLRSQATIPSIDEVVVVLEDQKEVIVNQVTRGSLERNVVSITGMAGIGKTTLANRIFLDPRVINHFHVRAWCSVSQEYRKRDLLLRILSQMKTLNDNIVTMADEDLEVMLYKQLKRNCYLIVIDDVWNTGAWDELQNSFPNDKNGSRILITSRLQSVVLDIQPESDPHQLRLLSGDESWELLEMKAFHGKGCPEELLEVGKQISKNCEGLPLSVVAVAGLLERTTKNPDQWKEIAETLSSRIAQDPQTRCMDILELSYNHLPNALKECFLYFGQFLNGKEIPVKKLTQMWIAEGFVQKTESMSLEDHAEHYLKDLIGRSLVLVAKRRSDGAVKACRPHDMLHELCLLRGKDEKFSQLKTSKDEPYSYFDDSVYGDDFEYRMPSKFQEYDERRLSICVKRKHFVLSRPSGPYVRTLLYSASSDVHPRRPYDISFIFDNFKLLKVLDLECINMGGYFPVGLLSLVHLKYLAISGDIDSIPSSIANLWNLETFIVKGLKGKVLLPDTIWFMMKLRHLHVNSQVIFSLPDEETGNFCILENLLSLSLASFSYGEVTEKLMRRFPNLRKLKCIFYSELEESSTSSNQFPRLELLAKLESLKAVHYGRAVDAGKMNFPLSLKRLTLSRFRLPWHHISAIGSLPNLEVLKLVSRAFEGGMWDLQEGEFVKLKFLQLEDLTIEQWNASSDPLPQLQQLVLRDCEQLEGVPIEFADIPNLQVIQVQKCGRSVEESVRIIQEEQLEMGNKDLKVLIGRYAE